MPDGTGEPAGDANLGERAVALGELKRMVIGEHEYVRPETDALRARRETPEGGELIPLHRPTTLKLRSRQRDVLAARQMVIAKTVGGDSGQILDRSFVGPRGAGRHDR